MIQAYCAAAGPNVQYYCTLLSIQSQYKNYYFIVAEIRKLLNDKYKIREDMAIGSRSLAVLGMTSRLSGGLHPNKYG